MRGIVFKAFENFTLLLPSLAFAMLSAVGGSAKVSDVGAGPNLPSLQGGQNPAAVESELKTPADPQVKAVLDKMAAAGIAHPTTVAEVRKAYLFSPEALGDSGARFPR